MTTPALTEELRLVEDDLARLRKTAADLRRRIGDRDEEPTDAAERSALIEAAEEQEALIDQLEARREHLLWRLGGPTVTDRESHRLRGLPMPLTAVSGVIAPESAVLSRAPRGLSRHSGRKLSPPGALSIAHRPRRPSPTFSWPKIRPGSK